MTTEKRERLKEFAYNLGSGCPKDITETIADLLSERDELLAACKGAVDLFGAWRDGIFRDMGITWRGEPPAVVACRKAIDQAESGA